MEHLLLRSKCSIFHNILKILYFKGVQIRMCGVKGKHISNHHFSRYFIYLRNKETQQAKI